MPQLPDFEKIHCNEFQEIPDTDLGIGSVVEVNTPETNRPLYGVIRWIGQLSGKGNIYVGVELEVETHNTQLQTSDGIFNDMR